MELCNIPDLQTRTAKRYTKGILLSTENIIVELMTKILQQTQLYGEKQVTAMVIGMVNITNGLLVMIV